MGAGKSTIGRHLAKSLGLEFVDSDHEIERRTGASIPLIFDVEGEAGFRQREKKIIDELSRRDGIVLATGGGVVLDPDNRAWLRERGQVVYLYATVEQLLTRTAKDRNRPLLQTADPRARLQELLEVRDPCTARWPIWWWTPVAARRAAPSGKSLLKFGLRRAASSQAKPAARHRRQEPLNETMVDDEDPGC